QIANESVGHIGSDTARTRNRSRAAAAAGSSSATKGRVRSEGDEIAGRWLRPRASQAQSATTIRSAARKNPRRGGRPAAAAARRRTDCASNPAAKLQAHLSARRRPPAQKRVSDQPNTYVMTSARTSASVLQRL